YGGFTTPTEAAALSVGYAIVIGVFVYREIPINNLIMEFGESMKPAAMVMAIITTAVLFAHSLTAAEIPRKIVQWVLAFEMPGWGFLIIIDLILVVMGMFFDVVSIMLITLPLLVPLLEPLGIDKVH